MIYLTILIFTVFVVLQVLDIYSTANALSVGGREANPIVKKVMDLIGILSALIILKVIAIALVVVTYIFYPQSRMILPG